MPDMLTHYLFAMDAKENMDEKNQRILTNNHRAYSLGCNGPDFFFYYHQLPWQSSKKKTEVRNGGSLLHNHLINEMFTNMFSYLKDNYSDYLFSYVLGFVMHYYCDRNCHPYIYYHTGLSEVKEIYGYYHKLIEVQIDQMMLELRLGKTMKDFKLASINQHSKDDLDQIFPLIEFVLKKTYNHNVSYEEFEQCLKDFHLIETITGRKTNRLKKLIEFYEKKTNALPFFSTAIYAPDHKEYDVLNLAHQEWYDPCDHKPSTDSFVDCYLRGVEKVEEMVEAIDLYLATNSLYFLDLIQDCGFDTNKPEGNQQKYFKCIYEEK